MRHAGGEEKEDEERTNREKPRQDDSSHETSKLSAKLAKLTKFTLRHGETEEEEGQLFLHPFYIFLFTIRNIGTRNSLLCVTQRLGGDSQQ
ncbi:hypothetical protein WR25_17108 [Diploscapter pachys]|uniref:Uncharacterized protein n=1 Tax=Diploscapter pachys TaxID=2018661 RepID=A0A2A2JA45_9BILA|nr:hypothetical protein WR25_17108 [Diploscapter pachys]